MGQALQRAVAPGLLPPLTSTITSQEPESSHEDHSLLTVTHLDTQLSQPQEDEDTGPGVGEQESNTEETNTVTQKFPDLSHLPPEVALQVLKNLNATDLCLASCVWQQLASDNILWQGLCR